MLVSTTRVDLYLISDGYASRISMRDAEGNPFYDEYTPSSPRMTS